MQFPHYISRGIRNRYVSVSSLVYKKSNVTEKPPSSWRAFFFIL